MNANCRSDTFSSSHSHKYVSRTKIGNSRQIPCFFFQIKRIYRQIFATMSTRHTSYLPIMSINTKTITSKNITLDDVKSNFKQLAIFDIILVKKLISNRFSLKTERKQQSWSSLHDMNRIRFEFETKTFESIAGTKKPEIDSTQC